MPETSQTSEAPQVPRTLQTSEAPRVPGTSQTSEAPQVQEAPRVPEPQVTPTTPKQAEAEEIDLERDAEASRKTTEPVKELSPETERTNSYQCYVMSGKGDTPEQKVNKAVKELNYHNMLVVVAVGDKTINNIGSIHTVAEKWGLLYSIIQRAISGIKEHCQGGRHYNKITGHLQRRSRCRQDESQAQDELDQEAPPIKKSETGKGKRFRKTSGRKAREKKTEKDSSSSDELPDVLL